MRNPHMCKLRDRPSHIHKTKGFWIPRALWNSAEMQMRSCENSVRALSLFRGIEAGSLGPLCQPRYKALRSFAHWVRGLWGTGGALIEFELPTSLRSLLKLTLILPQLTHADKLSPSMDVSQVSRRTVTWPHLPLSLARCTSPSTALLQQRC